VTSLSPSTSVSSCAAHWGDRACAQSQLVALMSKYLPLKCTGSPTSDLPNAQSRIPACSHWRDRWGSSCTWFAISQLCSLIVPHLLGQPPESRQLRWRSLGAFILPGLSVKKRRRKFGFCRQYTAAQALEMGLIICVVAVETAKKARVANEIFSKKSDRDSKAALMLTRRPLVCKNWQGMPPYLLWWLKKAPKLQNRLFLEKRQPNTSGAIPLVAS